MSMLKSIVPASIELDNVQKRMGLDVIGDVTFGALSKGELDLALSTAMPTDLKPPELRAWLVKKRRAQRVFADYQMKAMIYLRAGGNIIDYIAENGGKHNVVNPQDEVKSLNWEEM